MVDHAPVFILGVHKSGTSFLRNLLDGHPDLHTVPIELHYPFCQGLPVAYPRRHHALPGASGKAARLERMTQVVRGYDRSNDPRADAFLPGRFDLRVFEEHVNAHLGGTPASGDLRCYVEATELSLGRGIPSPGRRIVEKSVDNIEHAWWLKRSFPQARFLFILRDPRSNLVSFRKFVSRPGRFPSLVQPLRTIEMGFQYAALYRDTLPDLHILRYEDLLQDPRAVMEGVARFLAIPWDECLLMPTSLGQAWPGNSTTGEPMTGISLERKDRWKRDIQPIELDLIARSSLSRLMPVFGYPAPKQVSGWRRAPGESIKTYVRNRCYRIFADGA